MDIHDNPPLPDNVVKEEDNTVRRPVSLTHHVGHMTGGAGHEANIQLGAETVFSCLSEATALDECVHSGALFCKHLMRNVGRDIT